MDMIIRVFSRFVKHVSRIYFIAQLRECVYVRAMPKKRTPSEDYLDTPERRAMLAFMRHHGFDNLYAWSKAAKISESALRSYMRGDTRSMQGTSLEALAATGKATVAEMLCFNSLRSVTHLPIDQIERYMADVITVVEEYHDENGRSLRPDRRARAIMTLYQQGLEKQSPEERAELLKPEIIAMLMRMADQT
jgi:hypothetical protein